MRVRILLYGIPYMAKLADAEISTHYSITIYDFLMKLYHMAGWSSGEDIRFSFWNHEFDSRTGYQEYGPNIPYSNTYTTGNVKLSIPHPLKTISIILEIDIHIITAEKVIIILLYLWLD